MGRGVLPGIHPRQAIDVVKVFGVAGNHSESSGECNSGNLRIFGRNGVPLPRAGGHNHGIVFSRSCIKRPLYANFGGLESAGTPLANRQTGKPANRQTDGSRVRQS